MGNPARAKSRQVAQKFSATCGISCKKIIDGEQFKFKQGKNGKFLIEKICPVSGACMMEATLGALANVMFAAPHSSNAKEARRGLPSEKDTTGMSRQEIYTSSSQTLLDKCKINTTNKISDVEFLTTDRKFGGPVSLVYTNTMKSDCPISEALNASALAMSTADNTATSEKNKKMVKGASLLIVVLVLIIVLSGSGVWVYMKKKTGSFLL